MSSQSPTLVHADRNPRFRGEEKGGGKVGTVVLGNYEITFETLTI